MHSLLKRFDFRISLIYFAVAAVWIVASDSVIVALWGENSAQVNAFNTVKGLGFVVVTTIALFLILWLELRRRRRVEGDLHREIQSHVNTEASLRKMSRLYHVLSNGNQSLIRAKDENQLLQSICTLLTTDGGYRLAWVAYAHSDERKSVRPVASAGFENGYLRTLNITWDDNPTGNGPTGTAIRMGQVGISRYILTDPQYLTWRSEAIKHGYASSIALPLKVNGQVVGALNVYSSAEDAFDSDETVLLIELADDIGFGIHTLRIAAENEAIRLELEQEREISPIGIVTLSPDGVIRYTNAQAAQLMGLTRDSILQQTYNMPGWKITDFDGKPFPDEQLPFAQVMRIRQSVYGIRHAIELPNGKRILLEINAAPLFTPDGAIREVVATINDVTMAHLSATMLRDSEERYRLMFKNNPRPMWVYDQETWKFLEVNDAAIEQYGYSRNEFLSMRITDIRPIEEVGRLVDLLQTTNRPIMNRAGIWRHRLKNGDIIDVEITSHTLTYLGQNAVLILAQDVTEQQLAYAAVQKSEANLRAILDNTMISYVLMDSTTRVIAINRKAQISAQALFDKPIEVGDSFSAFLTDLNRKDFHQNFAIAMQGNVASSAGSFVTPQGHARYFEFRYLPAVSPTGEVLAVCLATQDVTEQKQAEEVFHERDRLKVTLEKEQELNSIKNRIMRTISHEFRTPLAVLNTSTFLLTQQFDRLDRDMREKHLSIIHSQVKRLDEMVGEITDAAHQIFGRFIVEPKPTNLNILCELIISDLQATIGGNHQLILIGDERLSHAMVDERLVNRILINLLSNAVKYSPQDTRINLLLRQEENEIVIEVADQGIGISPDDQKHLFEPFFRASNTGTVRGTGLGLNIVGDCVRLHQGTISLNSELGRGTTFTVRLPLTLESKHEETEKSA